jgi:hypothetical protein
MNKKLSWQNITVEHFQTIFPYIEDDTLSDLEKDIKILAIMKGLSEAQIDRMPFDIFKTHRNDVSFIYCDQIDYILPKFFIVKGRRFKINFDVRKNAVARYVEIKHFAGTKEEVVANLHRIIASCVTVQKRTGLFRYKQDHSLSFTEVAEHMKSVNFAEAWSICVFFCNLFANWMKASKDFLVSNLIKTENLTKTEAQTQVQDLCDVMAGFITSNKLPIIDA